MLERMEFYQTVMKRYGVVQYSKASDVVRGVGLYFSKGEALAAAEVDIIRFYNGLIAGIEEPVVDFEELLDLHYVAGTGCLGYTLFEDEFCWAVVEF